MHFVLKTYQSLQTYNSSEAKEVEYAYDIAKIVMNPSQKAKRSILEVCKWLTDVRTLAIFGYFCVDYMFSKASSYRSRNKLLQTEIL